MIFVDWVVMFLDGSEFRVLFGLKFMGFPFRSL
jgi:hypothetical protein